MLEHNLIYFATRLESDSKVFPIQKELRKVTLPTRSSTSLTDLRKIADDAGLPLSVILKKVTDPDQIETYISDPENGLQEFFESDLKKNMLAKDSYDRASRAGHAPPMIGKDYIEVIYSSYRRKIAEVAAIQAKLKAGAPNVRVE